MLQRSALTGQFTVKMTSALTFAGLRDGDGLTTPSAKSSFMGENHS
jgi:hypothetical protein